MTLSQELADQYAALTDGAGFVELTGRTLIEVAGADASGLLHSFTTNDIKKLPAGRGCEAFVTSPQGKTLGHVLILRGEKSLLISTTPGQGAALIGHLERYVISEDVNFRDMSAERVTLLVAGAQARDVLEKIAGIIPPTELLEWKEITLAGQAATLAHVEYCGSQSYFIFVAAPGAAAVKGALIDGGATPCQLAAAEMARIEAGIPLFGQDINDENLPQEIGRDAKAISFTKGCYLGQETIARIDAIGHVNRVLVGVRFMGDAVPPPGTPLAVDGKEIGRVTSAAWSSKLHAPLALAIVRRAQSKPGTELSSSIGLAVIVSLPLA